MADKTIKIGGATGFWGETDMAMSQFFAEGDLDYIVFDYLAEITMSILARARASDPELGYATGLYFSHCEAEFTAHCGLRCKANQQRWRSES